MWFLKDPGTLWGSEGAQEDPKSSKRGIKETAEYSQILNTYKFEKGLTDIRPVPHKEKKPLISFMQKRNTKETSQLIKFTFICNEKIEKRYLRLLETELNNIFTTYGRNDLKANVQTVYEGKILVSAAWYFIRFYLCHSEKLY